MEILNSAKEILLGAVMVVIAILLILALIRAIVGPRFTDRMVAINMIGTEVIILICCLACMLEQQYLVDVALIYAMLSFLAVVVMVNIYLSVFRERALRNRKQMEVESHEDQIEIGPEEAAQRRNTDAAAETGTGPAAGPAPSGGDEVSPGVHLTDKDQVLTEIRAEGEEEDL